METAFAEQVQDQVCTEFEDTDTDADADTDTDTDTDTCTDTDTDNKIVVVKLHLASKCSSSYLPRGSCFTVRQTLGEPSWICRVAVSVDNAMLTWPYRRPTPPPRGCCGLLL